MSCNPIPTNVSPPPLLEKQLKEAAKGWSETEGRFYLLGTLKPAPHGAHVILGPFLEDEPLPEPLCQDIQNGIRECFGPYDGTGPNPKALVVNHITIDTLLPGGVGAGPSKEFPAKGLDTLWWKRSALEKFAFPYYVQMYGQKYVDRLMEEFEADPLQVIGHLPGTEYLAIDLDVSWGVAVLISGFREFPSRAAGDKGAPPERRVEKARQRRTTGVTPRRADPAR